MANLPSINTTLLSPQALAPQQSGSGRVTADEIVRTVQQIISKAHPLRIIAFGSRARADHAPDSDLDLAVILEDYDPASRPEPVTRADLDARMGIDLLLMSRERYEFMKESIVSVQYDIANEGVVLYDARTGSVDRAAAARLAA